MMYLKSITLRNIKCFSELRLDFTNGDNPRLWTAVMGQNGLGKSTLLQAIGIVLAGPGAMRELMPVAEGWVRSEHIYGEIEAELLWTEGDAQTPHWPKKTPYTARYAILGENATPESLPTSLSSQYASIPIIVEWPGEGSSRERENVSKHMSRLKQTAYAEGKVGWLACGYGPFRRLSGGSQDADRILYSGRKSARFITLFREDAGLTNATQWLISLHNKGREGDWLSSRTLEQVRLAFQSQLLPRPADLVVSAHAALLSIDGAPPVPFSDLSDGYRSMLAMGIDLLRWASLAFPDEDDLTRVQGTILIDELDAHAHPAWQREIGDWLRRKFARLQFIIATHSPFLAQVADEPRGNIVLEKEGDTVNPRTAAEFVQWWRADQVLTNLLDLPTTRSPEFERRMKKLEEYHRKRPQLTEVERKEYEQLRLWAEDLPPAEDDPRALTEAIRLQDEFRNAASEIEALE